MKREGLQIEIETCKLHIVTPPREQRPLLSAAREQQLSGLLRAYIVTGLAFMLLPGTFLGVWNLFSISSAQSPDSVGAGWIQAHGHAQIFGWIGTFILGIGFYSIPKLRRITPFALSEGWVCWVLWTAGVFLRWVTASYDWHWRLALPISAGLELLAFLIFFRAVAGHKRATGASDRFEPRFEPWIVIVIGGTAGLFASLLLNLVESIRLGLGGDSPGFPGGLDQRFLALACWGFLSPFAWGFSARWMPAFFGLRPQRERLLLAGYGLSVTGVAMALLGWMVPSAVFLLAGAVCAPVALRLFETPAQPAKTRNISASFPAFVRAAYVWLLIAAALGVWAASEPSTRGITGASRHALTVGFLSTMVLSVAPRVLPAFAGQRLLFSSKLMFAALALLSTGCALRVVSEVIAYQGHSAWAWSGLPVSAVMELTAITLFAANMGITLASKPIVPACVDRLNTKGYNPV